MGYNHKLNRNQYSLDREDYKDLKDYERHCSSVSTKIQWSDTRVVFSCLAGCDRDELTSYFRNALGGL